MLLAEVLPVHVGEWLAVLAAYLLGALPFGLILGFLVKGVDIRKIGSGNIGATNVGRALGRGFALFAFVLDFAKGWLPGFWIGPAFASTAERAPLLAVWCGIAAICGHCWPVYLRFKGGKGVATTCGAIVGVDPVVFLAGGLAWLATIALTRFVSLSSIMMGLAFPLVAWWRVGSDGSGGELVWGAAVVFLLIFARHRANIARMLAGTEPRVGRRAAGQS